MSRASEIPAASMIGDHRAVRLKRSGYDTAQHWNPFQDLGHRPVNPGGFHNDISLDFKGAQHRCGIGGKIGIAGTGGKDDTRLCSRCSMALSRS